MRRILLVDDHEVLRDGVIRAFDKQPDAVAFGEAGNVQEALKLVREHNWDVVVLDISLGDQSGLALLAELKQLRPKLPVLIFSIHSAARYARRIFKAGAAGYLTKDCPRGELIKAISRVAEGGRYVSNELAEELVIGLDRESDRPPHESLSNREFEVMQKIGTGKTVSEIAELLSLSDHTISTYRARILEKMGMKTNAELTYYAIRNNLVE